MSEFSEAIRQAKTQDALLITTYAAFVDFDDLLGFLKEASDNGVTVTFAPMSETK